MIELGKTYQDKSGNSVRIICVDRVGEFSVVGLVSPEDDARYYRPNGSTYFKDLRSLVIPEDYSTYVIDEPVMVRDRDYDPWGKASFAGIRNGKPRVWCFGRTSWTSNCVADVSGWDQCRRPTAEELGEK